jgi:hypothetical protein
MQRTSNLINPLEYVINRFKIDLLKSAYTFCEQTQSTTSDGTCLQGCHADDNGRTDGRTMAAGSSVTWTHCSVRYEVTWDKTLSSARTRTCVRADGVASVRTGSVHAMDAKGLHQGSSNIPFSLPSSPWPREATVCLVHFVL